jgi:hypothetical protein
VRRFPTVFDSTKNEDKRQFGYQLCMGGIMQRVVALNEAYALLKQGEFMIGNLVSPKTYQGFKRQLQLSGHLPMTEKP